MKIVGNSITFMEYPLEDACRRMASLGFEGVEMWKAHLGGCSTKDLRLAFVEFAASLGLELFGLNSIGTGEAYYFQPLDDYEGSLRGLVSEVDYVQELGVGDILMWEGVRPPGVTRPSTETLERLTRLFREAVAYARQYNVRILVEPHPFTLGIDTEFLVDLCDGVDSEYFGVIYDCSHYGVGRPDHYIQDITRLNRRIMHIHFSDSDQKTSELHLPPGMGCMDLDGVVEAFAAFGFNGSVTLDLYGYPLPEEGCRSSIGYLRKVIDRLGI